MTATRPAERPIRERINVIHKGARDYYQVAIALEQAGWLGLLITEVYRNRKGAIVRPASLRPHVREALVHAVADRIITRCAAWFGKRGRVHIPLDFLFGFQAAFVHWRSGAGACLVYSYYLAGFMAFYASVGKWFGLTPGRVFCFVVHPESSYNARLLREDRTAFGPDATRFEIDHDEEIGERRSLAYKRNLSRCSGIITASDFSRRTIADCTADVPVLVVPYGSRFEGEAGAPAANRTRPDSGLTILLTVGNISQRKGVHWLARAFAEMSADDRARYEWRIAGPRIDPAVAALLPDNCRVVGHVDEAVLRVLYDESHLLVMPSLAEGFGLVFIEALSRGLPIICTPNTGAMDLIEDGRSGFVVAVSDAGALRSLLESDRLKPRALSGMSEAAFASARQVGWPRFRREVLEFLGGHACSS